MHEQHVRVYISIQNRVDIDWYVRPNSLNVYQTHSNTLQHAATRCNTLQHAATRCNTLQHAATHCNTLQHTVCQTQQVGGSWTTRRYTHIFIYVSWIYVHIFQIFAYVCTCINVCIHGERERERERDSSSFICRQTRKRETEVALYIYIYRKTERERKTREFQTQLLHYFSKSDNKSNHHHRKQQKLSWWAGLLVHAEIGVYAACQETHALKARCGSKSVNSRTVRLDQVVFGSATKPTLVGLPCVLYVGQRIVTQLMIDTSIQQARSLLAVNCWWLRWSSVFLERTQILGRIHLSLNSFLWKRNNSSVVI